MPQKNHGLESTTTIRIRKEGLRRLKMLLAAEGEILGKPVKIVDWLDAAITEGESRVEVRKEARKLIDEIRIKPL